MGMVARVSPVSPLWLLYHRDLKRTERVHVFRDFIAAEFENISDLLEGKPAMSK